MPYRTRAYNKVFVDIVNGQFRISRDKNKEPETANEFFDLRVFGLLIKEDSYQGTPYKKIVLLCRDKDESFNISFRLNSGYGIAFCSMLPKIDFREQMNILPSMSEINGKKKTTLFISQGGTYLEWHYTKDHPHDMPPLKKVVISGRTIWDNSEQEKFLLSMLEKTSTMLSDREKDNAQTIQQNHHNARPIVDGTESFPVPISNDDLPF